MNSTKEICIQSIRHEYCKGKEFANARKVIEKIKSTKCIEMFEPVVVVKKKQSFLLFEFYIPESYLDLAETSKFILIAASMNSGEV